ncbi:MAG: phosphotransferase family protein [Bryobacterales bacterium]|nr:phosphotransferase family protein [Bryobacterales bacterium]
MVDANPTAAPRPGEELDLAKLAAWFGRGALLVEQFPSGHSNLTYRVQVAASGEEFVLRRPPFGTRVKSAHDMGREYRVLSRLHAVFPAAPRPVAYCEDDAVLGAPFYLMERLPGMVIRKELPAVLVGNAVGCRRLSEALVDNLAALHSVDLAAAGLDTFGKPEGYVRRQIEGWTRRWADAQTEDVPEMNRALAWLAAHMPADSAAPALIHNDYKLDNILVDPADPARITGLLDWEMATVGDPLMDLGTALSYWVEPADPPAFRNLRFSPTAMPGFFTRREFVERYAGRTGRDVPHPVYYYVYGLCKLAVILQQIYYRYVHGHTRDERFAVLGASAVGLARQAEASIASGSELR